MCICGCMKGIKCLFCIIFLQDAATGHDNVRDD